MKTNVAEDHEALASDPQFRTILGIRFFNGDGPQAIRKIEHGGLVLVPSGPGLKTLPYDQPYRESLLDADLVLPDSGLMVLLWNMLERDSLRRLSGLEYLRDLVEQPDFRALHGTFWVMPSRESSERNLAWLRGQGIEIAPEDVYIAPRYGKPIEDPVLVELLNQRRPRHVMLTVGSGVQEILGHYLKRNLSYLPAIHCIGAAIAFLSGDQVHIPVWADRMALGWLLRCLWKPQQYVPRYWDARKLVPLMLRERHRMPSA
ncbi:MAG TPA: WecB/TagA/CpsF family glycosyltransferase [Acidisarcina sp.]|nr:WecB/TagA/CpsF family glycosyltransferase [Acidisarcina sp.]